MGIGKKIAGAALRGLVSAAKSKGECVSCGAKLRSGTKSNVCRKTRCVHFALEHELGFD